MPQGHGGSVSAPARDEFGDDAKPLRPLSEGVDPYATLELDQRSELDRLPEELHLAQRRHRRAVRGAWVTALVVVGAGLVLLAA